MRRKSNKTVNLTKINLAHRESCAKRERKDAPEPDFNYEKETPKGEWV